MQPMKYYIGDDAHKKYSIFVTVNENGQDRLSRKGYHMIKNYIGSI